MKRAEAARYGLSVKEVNEAVQAAIGGMNVTETVEGRERYPINVRYAREFRELYPQLAKRARVALVPFLLDGVAERRDLFLADQLHPSATAQPLILDNVWPTIAPLLRRPAKP